MMVRGCFAGLLLSLVLVQPGRADEGAAKKVEAIDAAAMAAYRAKDAQKAKTKLLEAIVLGKENGLETHPVMARTYLHLGVVQTEGLKDEEKGQRYLRLALRIQPDIQPTGDLATPSVARALERAREAGKPASAPTAAAPSAPAAPAKDSQAQAAAAEARSREKMTAAILEEKEREAQEQQQKAREEREKLSQDLASLQDREKRERERREKLEKDKQDLETQLAEARQREKKEQEEKERLQREKQDLEKQLAQVRQAEKTEREAKEKLLAQERDRQEGDKKEKSEREKLAAGPDMPGSVPEPVFCPTRDEWQPGEEVFVHCAPQSQVKAKELALYYRPSGALHYNSLLMDRSKKGWHVASIPAERVTGRMLQYYVEARGPKGDIAAVNGKANSPNILLIRPRTAAERPAAASPGKLTSASSTGATSRSGRKDRPRGR